MGAEEPVSGRDRVVPIDGETCGWLRAWAEKRGRLGLNGRRPFFCAVRQGSTGAALRSEQVKRMVRCAAEEAGIELRTTVGYIFGLYSPRLFGETAPGRWRRLVLDLADAQPHVNDPDKTRHLDS